jgi:hypothetical protein
METADRRSGKDSLSETAYRQLLSSMVTSYGLSPQAADTFADQALAAVATIAVTGGQLRLSEPVDQGVRLLMADPIRLAHVTQKHRARVRREVTTEPGKPGDIEATAAALADVGFTVRDEAWKDQPPAAAVLTCGRVLPQPVPAQPLGAA